MRQKGGSVCAVAVTAAASLLLIFLFFHLLLRFTRFSLSALARVPALSWDAVRAVLAYAVGFTVAVVFLLAALAVALAVAGDLRRTP